MSRAYRVMVRGAVEKIVHIDDGVCTSLELLPILPQERTAEILAGELEQRGFKREGTIATRTEGGTTVSIDLEKGTVTIREEADLDVNVHRERGASVVSQDRMDPTRKRLQEELDDEIQKEVERQVEDERKRTTARLEAKLKDLKKELDGISNRVTAEALKEKARTMGEIEEIVEDEAGGMTIKVRL